MVRRRGFTPSELHVVVAIIAMLISILVPVYHSMTMKANRGLRRWMRYIPFCRA